MGLPPTLICKRGLGSHSISLGFSSIFCKVEMIMLALSSSLSYPENTV